MDWQNACANDRWIVSQLAGKRGGFFVEAGAMDGLEGSATWVLEKHYGWTGICVEPSSDNFARLQKNRTCICDPRCLSDHQGEAAFREVAGQHSGYSGMQESLSPFKQTHWGDGTLVIKPTVTLTEMLREHRAPPIIDYLALDTEGSELRILQAFDFGSYEVTAISVEDRDCTSFLQAVGYEEVVNPFCPVDWEHYYVRRGTPHPLSLRLRRLAHQLRPGRTKR